MLQRWSSNNVLAFVEESSEVLYARDALTTVGAAEIAFLKERAGTNPRRRSRLCLHRSPEDLFHEMIIVHHRDTYVRPHRHLEKSESVGVLEGSATLLTFDRSGAVASMTELGAGSATAFHYRMPAGTWHSLLITSEWFVFVETTQGPFVRRFTEFPDWAPSGSDDLEASNFMRDVAPRALRECR